MNKRMNTKTNFIKALFLLLCIPLALVSCKDDDKEVNEWNKTYVTLMPVDYLRPTPTFTLTHSKDEGTISGEVDYQCVVKLQRAADHDVTVHLSASCDGISADKLEISDLNPVIKAGKLNSDTISVRITDWSELLSVKEAKTMTFTMNITGIDPVSDNTALADGHTSISFNITKQAEKEKEPVWLMDPTQWVFTFMDGVENAGSNSVAGTGSSDVATNGVPFWIAVDFIKPKTIISVYTTHWAGAYSPSVVELFSSEDGENWTSLGQFNTGSTKQQTITLPERVTTRYLKYQMVKVPGRVDIMRFYIQAYE